MPRKSRELRLQQASELLEGFDRAGLHNDKSRNFVADMISKMKKEKYPTSRQRNWLDKLIDEGVPEPKGDVNLLAKIDAAIAFWRAGTDRHWEQSVLADMRRIVFNGWNMSPKQKKLTDDLLRRHEDDITGANIFHPSEAQRADLALLVKLHAGYSRMWKMERPALEKAVNKVTAFLDGTGTIEEYHYNKLVKAMGSKLRKCKEPRFRAGDAGFMYDHTIGTKVMILCTGDVYVTDAGKIVNDWVLHTGEVKVFDQDSVSKR